MPTHSSNGKGRPILLSQGVHKHIYHDVVLMPGLSGFLVGSFVVERTAFGRQVRMDEWMTGG